MDANPVVHVIGTGTIGEPLIGLLCTLREDLGVEEVTFHKRTPLLTDRSKVLSLMRKGAKLCVDDSAAKGFQELGMEPSYEAIESINRAGVIDHLSSPPVFIKCKLDLRAAWILLCHRA